MKNTTCFLAFATLLLISFSCSNDKDSPADPGTSTDPVETNTQNTAYKPAFAGQTRAGGLKTNTAFEAKVITSGLTAPWGVKSLPDGRLLVTEKAGNMRIVTVVEK